MADDASEGQTTPIPQLPTPARKHARKVDGRKNNRPTHKRKAGDGNFRTRRTPAQLERQCQVYVASIRGKSIRKLAAEFGIDAKTVQDDIKHERSLRAEELGARRDQEKTFSYSVYGEVIRDAFETHERYNQILDDAAGNPESGGAKITDRMLDTIVKARERQDKILGIDAPSKIEIGIERLVEALTDLPD